MRRRWHSAPMVDRQWGAPTSLGSWIHSDLAADRCRFPCLHEIEQTRKACVEVFGPHSAASLQVILTLADKTCLTQRLEMLRERRLRPIKTEPAASSSQQARFDPRPYRGQRGHARYGRHGRHQRPLPSCSPTRHRLFPEPRFSTSSFSQQHSALAVRTSSLLVSAQN